MGRAQDEAEGGQWDTVATRRRFTRAEYYRMDEAGILREHDRVELIRREIVEMSPAGRRHRASRTPRSPTTARSRCGSTPKSIVVLAPRGYRDLTRVAGTATLTLLAFS